MAKESIRYAIDEKAVAYKRSKFLYFLEVENNKLVYDTLHSKLFKLHSNDYNILSQGDLSCLTNNFDKASLLLKNKLIYESDYDQTELLNYRVSSIMNDNILQITILPTNACNFRCKYCFEEHKLDYMSQEVKERIIKFFRRSIPKYKSVYICWFGGEPLLQKEIVYDIMRAAQEVGKRCGVPVLGQMTTNGYLLDLTTFEKLNELGVLHYHITIDGPQKIHDYMRPLASGKGTYDVIMSNLAEIKNKSRYNRFSIMVRANTNKNTYKFYPEFLDDAMSKLQNDKRFIFFIQKINDWGGEDVKQLTDTLLTREKDLWEEILPQMKNVNKNSGEMQNLSSVTSCSMKTKSSFAFYVDGSVYKCSMAIQGLSSNNDFGKVGELLSNGQLELDEKKLALFAAQPKIMDKCNDCCWLPFCLVGMCPFAVAKKQRLRCILEDFGLSFYNENLKNDFLSGKYIDLSIVTESIN